MNDVNYAETIIIPALQKRAQELLNNNLVLEISLLVEQEKNKNIGAFLLEKETSLTACNNQLEGEIGRATSFSHDADNLRSQISTMTKNITSLEHDADNLRSQVSTMTKNITSLEHDADNLRSQVSTMTPNITSLEHDVRREASLKESAIAEYKLLKQSYDSLILEHKVTKARNVELEISQAEKTPKKVTKTVANG